MCPVRARQVVAKLIRGRACSWSILLGYRRGARCGVTVRGVLAGRERGGIIRPEKQPLLRKTGQREGAAHPAAPLPGFSSVPSGPRTSLPSTGTRSWGRPTLPWAEVARPTPPRTPPPISNVRRSHLVRPTPGGTAAWAPRSCVDPSVKPWAHTRSVGGLRTPLPLHGNLLRTWPSGPQNVPEHARPRVSEGSTLGKGHGDLYLDQLSLIAQPLHAEQGGGRSGHVSHVRLQHGPPHLTHVSLLSGDDVDRGANGIRRVRADLAQCGCEVGEALARLSHVIAAPDQLAPLIQRHLAGQEHQPVARGGRIVVVAGCVERLCQAARASHLPDGVPSRPGGAAVWSRDAVLTTSPRASASPDS